MGLAEIMQHVRQLGHARDKVFERSTERVRRADRALGEARAVNDMAKQRIIEEYARAERAMRGSARV